MNLLVSFLTLGMSLSQEIDEVIRNSLSQDDKETVEFLEEISIQKMGTVPVSSQTKRKCPTGSTLLEDEEEVEPKNQEIKLQIFMSLSVPLETWKEYSYFLEKTQGDFVLRGLPHNSFHEFAGAILKLRQAGINAPIEIDPEGFELHKIQAVPAFVFSCGHNVDKICGNIKPEEAFKVFAQGGATAELAQQFLRQWQDRGK